MQKPIPDQITVTGVPVQLLAVDTSNNVIYLGIVTSYISSSFKASWIAPKEGNAPFFLRAQQHKQRSSKLCNL
jgi:hypothetical protein